MSDYRDPNDPQMRNMGYEPYSAGTKTGWVWLAAAIFFILVLAVAFGVGHEPNRVARNDETPPATQMTPPAALPNPAPPAAPSLVPPPAPAPAPAPNRP